MKTCKIGTREIPALLLGSSPFCGAGQFRERSMEYYRNFYEQPKNITKLLVKISNLGYPGAHILALPNIARAVLDAYEQLGYTFPVLVTLMPDNEKSQWDWIDRMDTVSVLLHGAVTDTLNFSFLQEFTTKCREKNYEPGFATHKGGITLPRITQEGIDAPVFLCPFNKTGTHVYPTLQDTLNALETTGSTVIGMKTFACGELPPEEAMEYSLPWVDAVTIGMVTEKEIEENARLFEKYHHLLGTKRNPKIT